MLLFEVARLLKGGGGSRVVMDTERGMPPVSEAALNSAVIEDFAGGVLAALLALVFDGAEMPLLTENSLGLI